MMYTLTLAAKLMAQHKLILKRKIMPYKQLVIKVLDIFANIFVGLERKCISLQKISLLHG